MSVTEREQADVRDGSALSALIKGLGKSAVRSGPRRSEEINAIEQMLGVRLPTEYRQFLGNFGALLAPGLLIFGLGDADVTGPPLVDVTLLARLSSLRFPLDLVPVEDLGNGRLACLQCAPQREKSACVVEVDTAHPVPTFQLAPSFTEYLVDRLRSLQAPRLTDPALHVLEQHILSFQDKFGYDHAKGGKLPRNHDWRPFRYCIQDVLFGATVVRHSREWNCLEVDVFLTADIPEYGPLAGARALTAFLLSEAYKCGGSMEIRFTHNVEGGRVPRELEQLADELGAELTAPVRDRLAPQEARAIYAAMTGFSPALRDRMESMQAQGRLSLTRVCYVVHHGVWTRPEVESIVLGSELPESVLAGSTTPAQRHLYAHDLLHARAALLGGALDRRLSHRERRSEDGTPFDLEDDVRVLEIEFDGETYAKQYRSAEHLPIPWRYDETGDGGVDAGVPFHVLVRARDAADLTLTLAGDLAIARQVLLERGGPVYLLFPGDFLSLPEDTLTMLAEAARGHGVGLLVCPEMISVLDDDAAARLERSRVLRQ